MFAERVLFHDASQTRGARRSNGHSKRDTLDIPSYWKEKKLLKHGDNVMRFLILAS